MFKQTLFTLIALGSPILAHADFMCTRVYSENSAIEELCPYQEGMAAIKISDAWGFINKTGQVAIPPQFEEVRPFSEGLAEVKIDDKWGFINTQGQLQIPAKFAEVSSFSQGLSAAYADDKVGYLDTKGEWAITPRFSSGGPFVNGVAVVYEEYRHSYLIDKNGQIIKQFAEPINIDETPWFGAYKAKVTKPTLLINKDGRQLPLPETAASAEVNSKGLLKMQLNSDKHPLYGMMTLEGKTVIPAKFAAIEDFQSGIAIATQPGPSPSKGLINTQGQWVSRLYHELSAIVPGLYVGLADNSKPEAEIINQQGKILSKTPCQFLYNRSYGAWDLLSGCDKHWLVSPQKTITAIDYQQPEIEVSKDYLLITEWAEKPEAELNDDNRYTKQWKLFGQAGLVLSSESPGIKGQYDWAALVKPKGPLAESQPQLLPIAILVRSYENLAIVTPELKIVGNPEWRYDLDATRIQDDQILDGPLSIKTESGWGAIDAQGNWVIPPKYARLTHFRYGMAFADTWERQEIIISNDGTETEFPAGYRYSRVGPDTLEGYDENRQPQRFHLKTKTLTPLVTEEGVERSDITHAGLSPAEKDQKWGFLDQQGRWVVTPRYDEKPEALLENQQFLGWIVGNETQISTKSTRLYGWVNSEGKEILAPQFDSIKKEAQTGFYLISQHNRHGLLDAEGKTLLPPVYERIQVHDDGWFSATPSEQIGTLNARGEWLVKPGPYRWYDLDNRPYSKEEVAGETYLVHSNGTISTKANPQPLADEKPEYWWSEISGEYGHEKTMFYGFDWKPRVGLIAKVDNQFHENRVVFKSNAREGLPTAFADNYGRIYGPFPYTDIQDFQNGRALFQHTIVSKGKKRSEAEELERYGYLDLNGKAVIPARYEKADNFSEDRAVVLLKGNLGIIDPQGQLLLHSAWRCSEEPVLLNGKGEVIWPADKKTSCN